MVCIPEMENDAKMAMAPLTEDNITKVNQKIERSSGSYESFSQQYILWDGENSRPQYCKLYEARLAELRPLVEKKAAETFAGVPQKKLHEIEEGEKPCVVIGTIFKNQNLKPSILKEISEEQQLVPEPQHTKYVGADDFLILEDELQRIQLEGNVDVSRMVTGVVCAAFGQVFSPGKFSVDALEFAGLPQPDVDNAITVGGTVLLVGGLGVGQAEGGHLLPLQLLADYVAGLSGAGQGVSRVVVAGNSIASGQLQCSEEEKMAGLQDTDTLLYQLASCCPVDLLPGEWDPANHLLPQQPLHRCLLPKSTSLASLHPHPNPYCARVGGRFLIGSAGQPITDIVACSDVTDHLDVLENLCKWRHLAPTAPDTLACHPYTGADPFIINQRPDVMFSGQGSEFATRTITVDGAPILLLSLPPFATHHTAALLDLHTLTATPLVFSGLVE